MADPYVIFPGTTAHVATPDVNRLDSDTAHCYQSAGHWADDAEVPSVPVAAAWAWSGFAAHATAASTNCQVVMSLNTTTLAPVVVAQDYTLALMIEQTVKNGALAPSSNLLARWYDSGGSYLSVSTVGQTVPTVGTQLQWSGEFTAPASAAFVGFQLQLQGNTGDEFKISNTQVLDGHVDPSTFVPSLRIVGSLYEEIVPADMPVVFAADGTPLTIGEGWAGNGYVYNRYDGPDSSAPLVASFQAGDVPVASQLPG